MLAFLAIMACGCATLKTAVLYLAIGVGLPRLPLHFIRSDIDEPLDPDACQGLGDLANVLQQSPRTQWPGIVKATTAEPMNQSSRDARLRTEGWNDRSNLCTVDDDRAEHVESFARFTDVDHRNDANDDTYERRAGNTIVIVSVSGGGSVAARLAAHTMALLEQAYNRRRSGTSAKPLIQLIDVFSTVSGGSLFASEVAMNFLKQCAGSPHWGSRPTDTVFTRMLTDGAALAGTRDLGWKAAVRYLSPGNLFIPPVQTLASSDTFLHLLAAGLEASYRGRTWPAFDVPATWIENCWNVRDKRDCVWNWHHQYYRLGDLKSRPLFLFNATALETGRPFVLAQSVLNFPSALRPAHTSRLGLDYKQDDVPQSERDTTVVLDTPRPACQGLGKPLHTGTTLEEINASPRRFMLAYAAMASAAFPLGLEALPIRKFGYEQSTGEIYPTDDTIRLSDGGVFDNSGMTSVVDLLEYIACTRQTPEPLQVVWVLISAEMTEYQADYPQRTAPEADPVTSRVGLGWPVRGLGVSSLNLIHFSNKRRIEEAMYRRLLDIKSQTNRLELHLFPVNLSELSSRDAEGIDGGDRIFELLQERAQVSFILKEPEDRILAEAARLLVSAPRRLRTGFVEADPCNWCVGPDIPKRPDAATQRHRRDEPSDCRREYVTRIDQAFADALVRAQDNWGPACGIHATAQAPKTTAP